MVGRRHGTLVVGPPASFFTTYVPLRGLLESKARLPAFR